MSSYVERLSLTELKSRKDFLEEQLNIVNDLIVEKEKYKHEENQKQIYKKEEKEQIKSLETKLKIKIKK